MFASLATYLTRKKIQRENAQRKKQFLDWNKVKDLCLIIESGEKFSKNEMDQFVLSLKKHSEVYFVETRSKQNTYGDWKCLSSKDKNFLSLPKADFLNSLKSKKFDLVICINRSHSLFNSSLCSSVNVSCRCGNADLFGETDLIVARQEGQDLVPYLKEIVKYLQMIRPA